MGRLALSDMLDQAQEDRALEWHLQYNHYPPHPAAMVAVARAAIDAARAEDPDRLITLPEGTTYRDGRPAVEAWRIVDSLHLGPFLEASDPEDGGQ
jgi:hypothetical protein